MIMASSFALLGAPQKQELGLKRQVLDPNLLN
jgi:hypothetical protein